MQRRRHPLRPALALLLLALATPAAGQDTEPVPLESLGFMAGCWAGTFDYRGEPGVIEERWTPPAVTAMLGVTRYMGGGRVVQFEFTSILMDGGQPVMTPYPNGERSEHGFRLTSVTASEAIFEAPEHDFPKRIVYRRDGDRLLARIDGGADSEQSSTWAMERTACEPVGSAARAPSAGAVSPASRNVMALAGTGDRPRRT